MRLSQRLNDWLETHWVTPAYAGWVLLGLTLFFLLAASNTLAGWLYVLSGVGLALLAISSLMPPRTLKGITVERRPLYPVSAGETLHLALTLRNTTDREKSLLEVQDRLPSSLGKPIKTGIATIPASGTQTWSYSLETRKRGIYRWQNLHLRTAAPLGLFWCRRQRMAKAKAIIYPVVLNLAQCPLIDQVGQEQSPQLQHPTVSPEGVTRSLRPYRWGDPMRLVHWRSSARHNELRIRELEVFTGGQGLIIGLDSAANWHPDDFEQAVIAAASMYTYAERRQISVQLWTAETGLTQGNQRVLEKLAQVQPQEQSLSPLPNMPMVWLSQASERLSSLPTSSHVILWSKSRLDTDQTQISFQPDMVIQPEQPLQAQLQGEPLQVF